MRFAMSSGSGAGGAPAVWRDTTSALVPAAAPTARTMSSAMSRMLIMRRTFARGCDTHRGHPDAWGAARRVPPGFGALCPGPGREVAPMSTGSGRRVRAMAWDPELELPIKLGPCSNGEYAPVPLGALEQEAIRRTRTEADATARRLGMDRRAFLRSVGGAALMLGVLAACHDESN